MVEKIKRDVRITTIYEGTSEILEMTIARDRWQEHLKTRGRYYHDLAAELRPLDAERPEVGADVAALALDCSGGSPRAGAARPADPQPARAVPARRADRLGRVRRQPGAPRRPGGG